MRSRSILIRSARGPEVGKAGSAPSKRLGRLRLEVMNLGRKAPGHSTDTPIPRGASSRRRPSDSATTPYLETLYALLSPEIRPAIEAVETMCPPSPCCSINGPKISIPQMVAIRLTPMVQFHDASVQAPY